MPAKNWISKSGWLLVMPLAVVIGALVLSILAFQDADGAKDKTGKKGKGKKKKGKKAAGGGGSGTSKGTYFNDKIGSHDNKLKKGDVAIPIQQFKKNKSLMGKKVDIKVKGKSVCPKGGCTVADTCADCQKKKVAFDMWNGGSESKLNKLGMPDIEYKWL